MAPDRVFSEALGAIQTSLEVSVAINGKTELLAVFGHPVEHSKSPAMHNAILAKLGINAVYVPLSPDPENFKGAIAGFRALHMRGANFTIPFKERLREFADELSPISKFTGSANTLYWKGCKLCATTTDPYGALKNLEEVGVNVENKNVALLGNGGAAAAICFALLEKNVKLTIVCRNAEKGNALADRLAEAFPQNAPKVVTFADFDTSAPEIILNTTPVGMHPNVNDTPLPNAKYRSGQFVYDIIYTPAETRLLREAREQGCKTLNGEGMLVHQGAASFRLWFPEQTKDVSDEVLVTTMREALK